MVWSTWGMVPFRAPHHSISHIALVGGGSPPKPGEISLSHHGVLFLDEMPEFNRHALEALREPLEAGMITISRAAHQAIFPAQFQLVAAMNHCPCGYASIAGRCRCTEAEVQRYRSKLSGPLLDRIDMQVVVPMLSSAELFKEDTTLEPSQKIAERVLAARSRQIARQCKYNSILTTTEMKQYFLISEQAQSLLLHALERLGLSARSVHRVLKISGTIADSDQIREEHLSEALSYRLFNAIITK